MKRINLTKEQFLYLLTNPNPFDQGVYGKLTIIGDYLFKVNYKDFIGTYITGDENTLASEVSNWQQVEKDLRHDKSTLEEKIEKYSRLQDTKSNRLIAGVLAYEGLFVGVVLNYFKDYISLTEAANIVSVEERDKYIAISYELAKDLLDHNIVPKDISENNILVNLETGDVVLIDLDDCETTYGPDNYVNDFPHHRRTIDENIKDMIRRLDLRRGIEDPREI